MYQAVIGIGSNSVRLLVADMECRPLLPILRQREGTRLFASLQNGCLTPEGMQATVDCVARQKRAALDTGAETLFLFATSATRDAKNQTAFTDLLQSKTGLALEILTGEEEARLSYLGVQEPGLRGVIDIGGGSTEWTVGQDGIVLSSQSAQAGAVRLAQRLPIENNRDIETAVAAAIEALQPMLPGIPPASSPISWTGVGGTCTTLAAMDLALTLPEGDLLEGHLLTETSVQAWAQKLTPLSLPDRRRIPGLPAQRADIILHGCALLLACMRLLRTPSIRVSNRGNLEGFLLRNDHTTL